MFSKNINTFVFSLLLLGGTGISQSFAQSDNPVKDVLIEKGVKSINVIHRGMPIDIERNQDRQHNIMEFYQGTWRGKIQPLYPFKPHPVETVSELEVIDYIQKISRGDNSVMIVDSRPISAIKITGMIPSAIQIDYKRIVLTPKRKKSFELFGVTWADKKWDFTNAKILVIYCNGFWCAKSPRMIRKLIKLGYPAKKLKYYRGGMQAWHSVGLTTVKE
jgi:rhodanese-related sulfurtransferase